MRNLEGREPMSKKSEINARYARYEDALLAAHKAAEHAQVGMVDAFACGFAWVVVHDRAFARWCAANSKEGNSAARRFYGSKHHDTGWCFWKPGNFNGQSIEAHEAGARAFRDSLAFDLQCRVEMSSRLD